MIYKMEVVKLIEQHTLLSASEIEKLITSTPSIDVGDWAFPCFKLSKELKKAPGLIAADLSELMEANKPDFINKIQAVNGYVNIFLKREIVASAVLTDIRAKAENYGGSDLGLGKTITIDYSSPNIAKHFHVGHFVTTVLGHSLYNILKFLGYHTVGINYLGDWGTQFGKLISAYKRWGSKEAIEENGIDGLTELYVRFHKEAETDTELNADARNWMLKMQNGDDEALKLWKWFGEISLIEYERIYKRLNITFDSYRGESHYNDKLDAIVAELREKNLLVKSEGAMIVDLSEHNMPPCLILRSDGGSLYPSRDIATALERKENYNFYKSLYVTALDQKLHFAQWMKVVELMGYEWASDMYHIPYGLVLFKDGGKLSTRHGNVVKVEDLLDEAVSRVSVIIEEKNPDLPKKDVVAEQVGIGALIFNQLYNNRIKDVQFDWDRLLNFDGETGPYVQYAVVRANSVLKKVPPEIANAYAPHARGDELIDYSQLCDSISYELINQLALFPGRVIEAADKFEPYIISRYLVSLVHAFNKFYDTHKILVDDQRIAIARVALTQCVRDVLEKGLGLLCITAPENM